MNNKASKRLLAASVASLMLVVAFCGFTYAGDDADADATEDGKTTGTAYVKKVTVAVAATNNINDDIATFNIVTTQNVSSAGTGITHKGSWKWNVHDNNTDSVVSTNADSPTGFSKYSLSVKTEGHVHTFTIKGTQLGTDSVNLYYELTSAVGDKIITQKIYYKIDATVVHALPKSGTTVSIPGYVGVGLVTDVNETNGWLKHDKTGLKFYAEKLPNGLSMNIDGTISGVPTSVPADDTRVYVYNGTSYMSTHTIKWNIANNVASITKIDVTGTDLVKIIDGRYLVKEDTYVTIKCTVSGNTGGTMAIGDATVTKNIPVFEATIKISGTGEKQIKITYTCDLDGSDSGTFNVVLEQYITVVSVDVVDDATTGIGIASGVTFAQPSQS